MSKTWTTVNDTTFETWRVRTSRAWSRWSSTAARRRPAKKSGIQSSSTWKRLGNGQENEKLTWTNIRSLRSDFLETLKPHDSYIVWFIYDCDSYDAVSLFIWLKDKWCVWYNPASFHVSQGYGYCTQIKAKHVLVMCSIWISNDINGIISCCIGKVAHDGAGQLTHWTGYLV